MICLYWVGPISMEIVANCVIKSWFTPALPDLLYCHCQIMQKFSDMIINKISFNMFSSGPVWSIIYMVYGWILIIAWIHIQFYIFCIHYCKPWSVIHLHIVKQDVQLIITIFADVLASYVAGPFIGIMVITTGFPWKPFNLFLKAKTPFIPPISVKSLLSLFSWGL